MKFRVPRKVDLLGWLVTPIRRMRSRFASKSVLVLGDSHASVFYHLSFDKAFPDYVFNVCSVGGATVSGLENPNSKTQAYARFENAIRRHPASAYITLLGEVDVGFVIWYRAQKYQVPVEQMLEQAVQRYEKLLRELRQLGPVIVISAPLPTIPDENPCGEVTNLRRAVKASQKERTQLTLLFNQRVRGICEQTGAYFIDLDAESLGEDGLVKKELRNRKPCDHHYDFGAYARVLIEKLRPLLSTEQLT